MSVILLVISFNYKHYKTKFSEYIRRKFGLCFKSESSLETFETLILPTYVLYLKIHRDLSRFLLQCYVLEVRAERGSMTLLHIVTCMLI